MRATSKKGLPDEFAPPERDFALYEDVPYQDFWEDHGRTRQDALERFIIADMLPASGRRILDLGCGYGRLAPVYIDRFDQVVLCDGSLSLLRDAQAAVGPRAVFVLADLAHLPFRPASFDCVLTIRVLQHVRDLQSALEEARRVIAGGGQMLFSYHNKRNARRILRYFEIRKIGDPFSLESAQLEATLISHHPRHVGTLLRQAGFEEPEYRGTVVLDGLARVTERIGGRLPAGARWARFVGRSWLAPWLIGRVFAQGSVVPPAVGPVDDLFRCPICHGDLTRSDQQLECQACRRRYPIDEGIFDFRL